jgi:peroxidase
MNIYFGIFVVFALFANISCKEQTSEKKDFVKTLSGYGYSPVQGSSPAYGTTNYSPNYFYSALMNLPLADAQKAIAESDHAGTVDCPYANAQWKCDPYSPWRTADGACNNLLFPWWGASSTIYKRMYPPAYEYGSQPRSHGTNGYPLENPRTIALKVHYPQDIYIEISAFFPQFGQFVNHDLSLFGEIKNPDGTLLKCKCSSNTSPDCINIPVPPYDYYNKDKKCLTQARSRPSFPEFNCALPYREQINEVTSWVDLSQVYGNNKQTADALRAYQYGKLKVSSFDGLRGDYLPTGCAAYQLTKNFCFQAGDSRVNQYPALTSQHTVWVREHNRIADALWKLNPTWSDELTYQTARTINIAQFQNIVYGTFLPILVGKQFASIFNLNTNYDGYFMNYDPYVFPNVANEFSSAAARYGHPLTVPYEILVDSYFNVYKNHSLWELMFNPKLLLNKNGLDGFVRGSVLQRGNWFSTHLTDYLSNDVMVDQGPHNPTTGHSLSTLNINRAREHGIPGYNYYREFAGLPRAKSWDDLTYIPKSAIDRLRSVYASVDDIDLYTGGLSEYPLPDGVVGPTFAYILARGFRDWKYGDRWYFENGQDAKIKFPLNQLNELRKSNIARIICDNTGIKQITLNPFLVESKNNYIVDCKTLPTVNLNLWKDYGRGYKNN